MTHSIPTFQEDRAQPTCQEEEHIAYCLWGVLLSAGGYSAVSRFQVSFLQSVGGLLECEECRQKGTQLLGRSWL